MNRFFLLVADPIDSQLVGFLDFDDDGCAFGLSQNGKGDRSGVGNLSFGGLGFGRSDDDEAVFGSGLDVGGVDHSTA